MVEDNPGDIELVREALHEHEVQCDLIAVNDGEKALQFIGQIEAGELPVPALIILDLNLPKIEGRQLLKRIRASTSFGQTPVVILSSSDAPDDIEKARKLGATRYIRKPSNLEEFMKIGGVLKQMLDTWSC